MPKFLLLSIKPEFSSKIIESKKTIELRKHLPNAKVNDYVIIYSTAPEKAIVGFGKIKSIIKTTPENMWLQYSAQLGITKSTFNSYYKCSNTAVGIEITSVCKFQNKLFLSRIKEHYPLFSPPQTFRYFSNFQALKMYKIVQ